MPFTLVFNSKNNTDLPDIACINELAKYTLASTFDSILFDIHFNQPIPKLPDCIKKVQFGHYFMQDISNIGDHIESIIFVVRDFNYNLATFPKGLKELEIRADTISSRIENINPGLENLAIQCSGFNEELDLRNTNLISLAILSSVFNSNLLYLPSTLKNLRISCSGFNQQIDNLPPGLEYFRIASYGFNQQIDNLPPGLKTLILEDVNLFIQPLNNLPQGLETFKLNLGYEPICPNTPGINLYKHSFENLPNTIKKLELVNYWGDLNTIVDNVVELDIWFPPTKSIEVCAHIQHWKKIPSSLKILNINREIPHFNKILIDIIKTNINIAGIQLNGNFI